MGILNGKRILLCIAGGIAAYKSAEFTRMLIKNGAEVRVAMTESARKFVTPLTFQALSNKAVMCDLFDQNEEDQIGHIEAARWANCIAIVPATANIIGKMANGIADDLISTIMLAALCPIVVAPSMNWAMWQNAIVKDNVKKLSGYKNIKFVLPESGDLACGETGKGRLAELEEIMDSIYYATHEEKDLSGEFVLVTAGPTYEDIDPVRFVGNRSSGKMGFAIAKEARARGAKVVLIAGPNKLHNPGGMDIINVRSAEDMLDAVMQHAPHANIIIKSAAVADYRPARPASQKIHKSTRDFQLAMKSTTDILKTIGSRKGKNQFLVGFAAETQQVLESGKNKLRSKNLDLIVVNDISQEGAGFDVDTNVVRIIDRKGHVESLPKMDKSEVAHVIFDIVQKQRASKTTGNGSRKSATRKKQTARKTTSRSAPARKATTSTNSTKASNNTKNPRTRGRKPATKKSTETKSDKAVKKTDTVQSADKKQTVSE